MMPACRRCQGLVTLQRERETGIEAVCMNCGDRRDVVVVTQPGPCPRCQAKTALCRWCGQRFHTERVHAQWCSAPCRNKAWRAKQRKAAAGPST